MISEINQVCNTNYSSIEEFLEKADFDFLSTYVPLTKNMICVFAQYLNWAQICTTQVDNMCEDCLEYNINYIDWTNLCYHKQLSETFLRKHSDKINFCSVALKQNISEQFIVDFLSYIDLDCLAQNQNISEEIKNKYISN